MQMVFAPRGLEMPALTDDERASTDSTLPTRRAEQLRNLVQMRQQRVEKLQQELSSRAMLVNLRVRVSAGLLFVSGEREALAQLRQHIESTHEDIQCTLDEAMLTRLRLQVPEQVD